MKGTKYNLVMGYQTSYSSLSKETTTTIQRAAEVAPHCFHQACQEHQYQTHLVPKI